MSELQVERLDVLLSHFKIVRASESLYFPKSLNPKLVNLLRGLLEYSPKLRWGPSQILQSDFLSEFRNHDNKVHPHKPVILKINDNKKYRVTHYLESVHKNFAKSGVSLNLSKLSLHSKRSSSNSLRKKTYALNRSQYLSTESTNTTTISMEKTHKNVRSLGETGKVKRKSSI